MPALKRVARAAKRFLAPGLAFLAAALSTGLTLASVPFEVKLAFIAACGLVIVVSIAWTVVKGAKLRVLQFAGMAAIAFASWFALSSVVEADTIRIDYPRVPSSPTMTGSIQVDAPRAAETFVLVVSVRNQQTAIEDFFQRSGPEGQAADVQAEPLTAFDRQVQFTNFGAPHFTRLSYRLSAPAILVVDRRPPLVADVLFQEDVRWYRWFVRLSAAAIFVCGALVSWRRSS